MQDEDEDTRPCMRTSTAAEHVAGGWLYFALLFLPLNSFFFLLVIMECFFFSQCTFLSSLGFRAARLEWKRISRERERMKERERGGDRKPPLGVGHARPN